MLLIYLVLGATCGLTAAIAGLLAGASVWSALGLYVLGGFAGIAASALALTFASLLAGAAKNATARRALPQVDLPQR